MLDNISLEGRVLELIREILIERRIDRPVVIDDNLRLDVGLTSLDMTNLVLAIESSFDLEIPECEITPANFRSVRTISGLLSQLLRPRGQFDPINGVPS
jgi:acyl carrier protein